MACPCICPTNAVACPCICPTNAVACPCICPVKADTFGRLAVNEFKLGSPEVRLPIFKLPRLPRLLVNVLAAVEANCDALPSTSMAVLNDGNPEVVPENKFPRLGILEINPIPIPAMLAKLDVD